MRLVRRLPLLVVLATLAGSPPARADDPAKPPPPPAPAAPDKKPAAPAADLLSAERLEAHVRFLASPDLGGRATAEDRKKASDWIAERLKEAGAKPVPGLEGWFAPFQGDGYAGRNVLGWIAGATDEYVILSAHYDHLGTRGGLVHPGADDNASGVAVLIEATRALAAGPKPARSVLVASFDLEEDRCRGSAAFVEKPPVPLARCAAMTTADMLGRSLADIVPGLLLVMGEERSLGLEKLVSGLAVPDGVLVRRLGMDFNALGWSDYAPFFDRKIPSLFFTSGACRDYHRPTDTADKIEWPMLAARGTAYLRAVRALADAPERPAWDEAPVPRLAEIEAVLDLVRRGGEKEEELGLPERVRPLRAAFQTTLESVVASGKVTPGQRTSIRVMALQMFGYVANREGR